MQSVAKCSTQTKDEEGGKILDQNPSGVFGMSALFLRAPADALPHSGWFLY